LLGKPGGKLLGKPRRRWKTMKIVLRELRSEGEEDRGRWRTLTNTASNIRNSIKAAEFLG
jgi:hypothetical protein